jgi:hypothetical protein
MDTKKVKTIQELAIPTRVQDVQSFLGFCKFLSKGLSRGVPLSPNQCSNLQMDGILMDPSYSKYL